MTPQPVTHELFEPPRRAGRARRAFHLAIALAGWVLFAYWWWLVLGRTGHDQMVWTGLFVGISLAVVVLVTVLWVVHNVVVFRRKGPRREVRERAPALLQDSLGRGLRVDGNTSELVTAPVVRVVVSGRSKVYRPVPEGGGLKVRLGGAGGSGGGAGGAK
jgi:hypothetical protein